MDTLAPHGGHGDGGAGHRGVLGLPLRGDRLDLGVELDALVVERENCGFSSAATMRSFSFAPLAGEKKLLAAAVTCFP